VIQIISDLSKRKLLNLWMTDKNASQRTLSEKTGLHRNTIRLCIEAFKSNIEVLSNNGITVTMKNFNMYADEIIDRKYRIDNRHAVKMTDEMKNIIIEFLSKQPKDMGYTELFNKFYDRYGCISFSSFYNFVRKIKQEQP